MDRLLQHTRQDMGSFVRDQFRLLLEQIVAFTPPRNLAQGRRRVQIDLGRVYRIFDEKKAKDPRLLRIVRRGDIRGFRAFVQNAKLNWRAEEFRPAVHTAARDVRGRVSRVTGGPIFVIGKSEAANHNRWLRRKQSHVGLAKSGWAKALAEVGGTVPAWVATQGVRYGGVINRTGAAENPELIAINRTPWAVRKDEGERIIAAAMKSRAARLQSALRTQLRLAAQKSGIAAA